MYEIVAPSGAVHLPPKGRCWGATEGEFRRLECEGRVYFPKGGAGKPRIKLFAGEEKGLVPMSLWLAIDAGDTEESKKEILALFNEDTPFGTPKPERLMERIIRIATNRGELVLDSFLGSGTTAAVAHKMGRHWIGVEMGDHAETNCAARLRKVIDGEQGGISKDVSWQGGGGFRYCRLGEPVFDGRGSIRPGVGFADLACWVWYRETRQPMADAPATPLLGVHQGTAYYLLYNGILGDRRTDGGNVLAAPLLECLASHDGPRVVFGEACRLHESKLAALNLVSTTQALRVDKTDTRKVYAGHEGLDATFERLTAVPDMDTDEQGRVLASFVNLCRAWPPLVIVDEAHNARTPLSFDTLKRFAPAFILELTATPAADPKSGSNVLVRVSARELRDATMGPMPMSPTAPFRRLPSNCATPW